MPPIPPIAMDLSMLPMNQRISLAQSLWDSVHADAHAAPFTQEQLEEIDRRIKAADAGELAETPARDVFHRLSQNL